MNEPFTAPLATHTVADAPFRQAVVVRGRVAHVELVPWAGGPVLEAVLRDDSSNGSGSAGELVLAFLGRRTIPGLTTGSRLTAAAMVANHRGRRILLNPHVWLLAPTHRSPASPSPVLAESP